MNSVALMSVLLAALTAPDVPATFPTRLPLKTVERVDLERYAGRWYEIARYPNRFQRDCESDTMAEYTLRKNGKLDVVNSCRTKSGKVKTARGKAKVVEKSSNARLKVTFFWPFYGDYWVVGLGPEYRYAIVGEPKRNYVWILSRTPVMDDATYGEAIEKIKAAGFEPDELLKTRQSAAELGVRDGSRPN